jgi:hypothetical protein
MAAMKRQLGLWFSIALAILLLGIWVGSMLGSAAGRYWYGHYWLETGSLSGPDQANIKSELADLSTVQSLHLLSLIAQNQPKLRDEYLRKEIEGLMEMKRRSKIAEIKPVIDLVLGLAYVDSAIAEEQNHNAELTKKNIHSAQALFESLGWQDYSEEALKAVAKRELISGDNCNRK